MSTGSSVPGPPASVLAAVLRADPDHPYDASDPRQRRTAVFSASPSFPDLPSLMTEVVFLPQYAVFDANVEVTGTLASHGWATGAVVAASKAYTAGPSDAVILADATAGPFTVTLPDATLPGFANPGQRYTVKKTDSSANVVTLAASAGQLIDGAATQAISPSQSAISVVFSGTGWEVTSGGSAIGTNSVGGVTVSGTPSAGQVLTATSSAAADWQAGFASPMTSLGDMVYEDATPAPARLAGNTSAARQYLTQTGTGSVSAAPAWGAIAAGDLPAATTSAQGAVVLDGTAGDIAAPGTQAAGSTGKAADAGHVHPASFTATAYTAPAVSALTDGGTISTNAALGNVFSVTLGGNRTMANPSNPVNGQMIEYWLKQDATGSRTVTWASAYKFGTGLAQPTLSTAATTTDCVLFQYNSTASKWWCLAYTLGF